MTSTLQLDAPDVEPVDTIGSEATASPDGAAGDHDGATVAGISVIIPVRNDPGNLDLCLRSLKASDHPTFEIIVVDDASTDGTADVALRHGVRLMRSATRCGPATARNRGAKEARFPYLFFVDADVCVQPSTVRRMVAQFSEQPSVDAFFGSYDSSPGAPNVLSQYRNLLHHFVHQSSKEDAFSFWSGCGAIKTAVFLELGGFDVGYDNASVEDIELGSRLRRAGHRIALVKDIQVQHLKRWTLAMMIHCDIRNRAIPWTQLLLRQGKIPNDLNLRHSQRLSALLTLCLVGVVTVGSWFHPSMLLLPTVPLLGLVLIDRWSLERPVPKWGRYAVGLGTALGATALALFTDWGQDLLQGWTLLAVALLLTIVALNGRFYLFLLQERRPLFVLLVMPAHILYYLYSSLAFAYGLGLHVTRGLREQPPAAEDGESPRQRG